MVPNAHDMGKAGVWGQGTDYSFFPKGIKGECLEIHQTLGHYAESTDGLHWNKRGMKEIGEPGSYDREMVIPFHNEPIILGDRMYIYYTAAASTPKHPCGQRSLGVASIRTDAFIGLAAGNIARKPPNNPGGEATIITKPVKVSGSEMYVNFEKIVDDGYLKVELRNPDWTVIEGFEYDNCIPVKEDSVSGTVRWKDRKNTLSLIGRDVMICMKFGRSIIYSYRFGE